jgi:hypothetical protein
MGNTAAARTNRLGVEDRRTMVWAAIISAAVAVVGMALIVSGGLLFLRQRSRLRQAVHADGTVVELIRQRAEGEGILSRTEEGKAMRPKYLFRPRVRFRTSDGQTVVFTPSLAMRPEPYQVGQPVAVLYDPDHPETAQIDHFLYLWFHATVPVLFGVLCLELGLLGIAMAV